MGFFVGRDAATRLLARALVTACTAGGLLVLSTAPSHASDDYPWAWQGQCPIVPMEPIEEPEPTPSPSGSPSPSGQPSPGPGGEPTETTPPPPPPPVHDPVTGHMYDPRGPKPTCERRVWSINGSYGDPWGFVLRNCTSFVAWRLQERNGFDDFHNHFGGIHWGDAHNWDDAAKALGYRVDNVPAIGAVAQTDDGRVGHVAWVTGIGPGTVTIEEYNHATPGGYGTRTVPVEAFRYLHLDDVAPSPLIGSDKPLVSVPDGLGESWTARVDDGGTLRLTRPGGRTTVVGPEGTFSPVAAPTLVASQGARPWLAATTREGRVLIGRVALRGRTTLRDAGTSSTTASPAVHVRASGPILVTVSAEGTLTQSRLTPRGRWSRPERIGAPGSWATHTAPVLASDDTRRTWLVAVTKAGATYVRRTVKARWSRLERLRGPRASITSTPSLALDRAGTLHLHQVDDEGQLGVRTLDGTRWSKPETYAGAWSPYSSPTAGLVGGALQVAAVDARGRVMIRAAVPGEKALVTTRPINSSLTRSPGLVTRHNSGVFVLAPDHKGTRATLLTRPAEALVKRHGAGRAGFTP